MWSHIFLDLQRNIKAINFVVEQFALDLLHEKKILITRGGGFNWAEPDHFRIVYLPRMEVLKESLEDLADFFDHYRQS